MRWLPLLSLGAWTTALVAAFATAGGSAAQFVTEPLHPACGMMILAMSVAPGLILGIMVRRGAPLELGWSGSLTSLAALGFAALGVQAVCPIPQPAHLLMAHVLPVVVMALTGAAVSLIASRRRARVWVITGLFGLMAGSPMLAQDARPASAGVPDPAVLPGFTVVSTTAGYIPATRS